MFPGRQKCITKFALSFPGIFNKRNITICIEHSIISHNIRNINIQILNKTLIIQPAYLRLV